MKKYTSICPAAICAVSILLIVTLQGSTLSQTATRSRVIELYAAAAEDPPVLELLSIEVRGFPVSLSKPFTADAQWLKQMTIHLRNVSGKPIRCFNFGGGLDERLDQISEPGESFKGGITWKFGECVVAGSQAKRNRSLQPNASVELSYADVAAWAKLPQKQDKGRSYAKLSIGAPYVQFSDGSDTRSGGIKTQPPN